MLCSFLYFNAFSSSAAISVLVDHEHRQAAERKKEEERQAAERKEEEERQAAERREKEEAERKKKEEGDLREKLPWFRRVESGRLCLFTSHKAKGFSDFCRIEKDSLAKLVYKNNDQKTAVWEEGIIPNYGVERARDMEGDTALLFNKVQNYVLFRGARVGHLDKLWIVARVRGGKQKEALLVECPDNTEAVGDFLPEKYRTVALTPSAYNAISVHSAGPSFLGILQHVAWAKPKPGGRADSEDRGAGTQVNASENPSPTRRIT